MSEKHDAMWGAEAGEYIAQQQAEIERLRAALEEIISPLAAMQKRADAEGSRLSDMAYSIANSVSHLQEIARRALED